MDYFEQVTKAIISEYRQVPGCRAIALTGSRARGTDKPLSNVDLMIVSFEMPRLEQRREIAQSLADASTTSRCVSSPIPTDEFSRGGLQIRIWHILSDIICDRVAEIEKKRHVTNSLLISSLFEARILWDPANQLKAWQSRINPIPQEYVQKIIPEIFAEVVSVVMDLSRNRRLNTRFYFNFEIAEALKNLYELVFLLNGKYLNYSSRMNETVRQFGHLPEDFSNRVDTIISIPDDEENYPKKLNRLTELAVAVGNLIVSLGIRDVEALIDQLHTCY